MAIATATEYAATIDEKWDRDIEMYRYSESVLLPRILSKSEIVKESGDIINMTIEPQLVARDVTQATGAFTIDAVTPTTVQLIVNQHKTVSIGATNLAEWQAFWTPDSVFPKSASKALAETYENFIATTGYQGSTLAAVGSEANPVAVNNNNIRVALLRLAEAKVPQSDLTVAVPARGLLIDILDDQAFSMAYAFGGNRESPIVSGNLGFQAIGCKIVMTQQIALVGGTTYKALVFHKSSIAFAMQKNNYYERFSLAPTGVLGKAVLMANLYGGKVLRGDHIAVINTPK
jgi:hypothetical protein